MLFWCFNGYFNTIITSTIHLYRQKSHPINPNFQNLILDPENEVITSINYAKKPLTKYYTTLLKFQGVDTKYRKYFPMVDLQDYYPHDEVHEILRKYQMMLWDPDKREWKIPKPFIPNMNSVNVDDKSRASAILTRRSYTSNKSYQNQVT